MFSDHNKIRWMDVATEKVVKADLSTFFRTYIHLVKTYTDKDHFSVEEIDFNDRIIKVQDMFGWTDVLSVYRIDKHRPLNWNYIESGTKWVIVSDGTTMLTYDPSKMSRGFHGEVKYESMVKSAYNLKENVDILRLHRGGVDENYNSIEFAPIHKINTIDDDRSKGYVFKTRSGKMNISGIHCFSA